jgi:hypothetical protein
MPAVILADISTSMVLPEGSRRRCDLLEDVLQQVLGTDPTARVIAFGSTVQELPGLEPGANLRLPEPAGSTALHLALEHVAKGPKPSRLVVISDGQPDDPQAALSAARVLAPIIIDAMFVGADGDRAAIGFMNALRLAGGDARGIAGARSLAKPEALADEIVLRLSGPSR